MSSAFNLPSNPYLALGLQRNPFFAEDDPSVPEILWVDRGWSQAPPCQSRQLIQVMGDKGFGKTSHLKRWQSQTGGPYCYYPPGLGRLKLPPVAKIAYWDEADRIPLPFLVASLLRAAHTRATIVIGTHRDLGNIAGLMGLSVRSIDLPPLDVETLLLWTSRSIAAVRLPQASCYLQLSPKKAREVVSIANGSWRDAADYLHIWAAEVANNLDRV